MYDHAYKRLSPSLGVFTPIMENLDSLFLGCQITLELDSSIPFKKKSALKQSVIQYGGIVSFIVTKKVI